MHKHLIRSAIFVFWLLLIFGILYLPKLFLHQVDGKTINVFVWGDILSPAVVSAFEEKTGIKINLSYYASNEELIVKLKATEAEGYDLIIPSDYAVHVLAKEGLLKPLDKAKFAHWDALNPHLVGHYFDPDNTYSIPFEWELFGFGIDTDFFEHPRPSWKMLFDPAELHYKVAMNNDPIEAIAFASFYLFGNQNTLSTEQSTRIRTLLKTQKPWVAAYANFRGDYFLATKNVALVLASSSYIWRAKQQCHFVRFVIPEEGTFLTIENFCIPKASTKENLVFQFINYLSTPASAEAHFKAYFLFPATTYPSTVMDTEANSLLQSSNENFSKYHFIRRLLPERETRDIWIDVKS